ncbi:MAG TPA: hypothetical protein VFY84_04670 [Jiangellales bacterium]|nr:hypothetical protein [Jiangellales bacterium]
MSADRLNREQFQARLAPLDSAAVRKVLWTLYWRGSAALRQRIETEIAAGTPGSRPIPVAPAPTIDLHEVLDRVEEFAMRARKGAYLAGDRRVSPKQRTRWRYIFRDLFADARLALAADNPMPAAQAMATLVDIACETGGLDYFRSEDPVEAAKIVISDEVGAMWRRVREHAGLSVFAKLAAPQLVRWEREHGWTRGGWGQVAEKETTLAAVLIPILDIPDAWRTFADHYLAALDALSTKAAKASRSWDSGDWTRRERTGNLAEWHLALLPRLHYESDGSADRLATHPALGGPGLVFLQAHLARLHGDLERAHKLVHAALTDQPSNTDFRAFADDLGRPAGR